MPREPLDPAAEPGVCTGLCKGAGWAAGCLGEVEVPSLRPCPPQFLREEYYKGRYCAVWQNVTRWAQKKNVYTLWVTNSSCGVAPVHYEMQGYNSLLGSHYDKYEIAYTDFDNSYPASIFDLPVNGEPGRGPPTPSVGLGLTPSSLWLPETKCGLLPGSVSEQRVLANPMEDFVGQHRPWAHRVFHDYRRQMGRRYSSVRELEHRQSIFVHNMRYRQAGA